MKPTTVALALAVVASLLAGCGSGGGSSSSESTAPTISRADAARQTREADAICSRMVGDAHHLGRTARTKKTSEYGSTLEFTTDVLIVPALPVVERSARELRAVRGVGGEPQLDAYVGMFDPILSLLVERVAAGRRDDSRQAHEIEEQLIELAAIQKTLAKEAGLQACTVDLIGSFAAVPSS